MSECATCGPEPDCERCGGTGTIEVENAHEMEVWACPACRPGIVGEVV